MLIIIFLTTAVSVYGQNEFKEYKGNFVEFLYPIEWESVMKEGLNEYGVSVDKDKRISFDIPTTKDGAFTILIEDSDKKNLEELLQEQIGFYSMEDIMGGKEEILEITDVNLSGEPAKKIIVYAKEVDKRLDDTKIMQIVSLHGNKEYSIVYLMNPASFDNYIPIIEKIVQSVKFTQN